MLGVPKAIIIEDYLLTNETMKEFNEKVLKKISSYLNDKDLQVMENILGIEKEFLESVFQSIIKTYGNTDIYFAHGFGIIKEKRKNLQSYCLESDIYYHLKFYIVLASI
ncbi:hypothetical protein CN373_15170 [Bacillus cereus]|uniref:tyrosine-protein phosphatase n=1 Tax=Bacillus cereus TaxID=1396 RepID=UPI000BF37DF6|nr:hypothetical protein CN373_15170 [Bacillus cereus]PGZ15178.1 hypothetical protein COE46_17080 [Bacillus cereus]